MDPKSEHETKVDSVRTKVRSLSLVMAMAVMTGTLRFAMWAANQITLSYLYGSATVRHDHLRIVRVKPDLVVSNGDVLRGIGAYHYFVGVGIWLPAALGLAFLIDRFLLPEPCRMILRERQTQRSNDKASAMALLFALPMAFLVTVWLPEVTALALAAVVAAGALIGLRKIPYGDNTLE